MTGVSSRMAAPDAQLFWLSASVPNDQFLVYLFDGTPDIGAAIDGVRRNAGACPEMALRIVDDHRWRYPRWRPCPITADQFVEHPAVGWPDCLDAVSHLNQLDLTRMAWRVNVFPPNVVVVQIAHALADGTRSSALAARLLGRRAPLPVPVHPARGFLPARAVAAARAHRQLMRDVEAGLIAAPRPPRPLLSVNAPRSGAAVLRTLLVDRQTLRRPTVTVGALVAVSEALGGYLAGRGEDASRLGAEVPLAIALSGPAKARNNFRNVSVDLHPELEPPQRAEPIAAELAGQRLRVQHAATAASDAAFAAVPARLLRWGVGKFDPSGRSATVAAHTVVSSVYRGPADLSFGGSRVLFTAGFPALSPMMGLTHGVHGIGDTVAVSVRADPAVIDVDDYLSRLSDALAPRD
ncbi:MAG: WSD1 family O-acyltransferase [Mycobacterium sp.]|nr:WSD1 family O-acyltransferase [Mycobacterium sp.]